MKYNIQTTTVQYFKHSDGTEIFFRGKFSPEANLPIYDDIQELIDNGLVEIIEKEEEAFVEEVIGHVIPRKDYVVVRQYPQIGEQLDTLWHDINNGVLGEPAKESEWYQSIKEIKDNHPKP
jgi:hypothetical protein